MKKTHIMVLALVIIALPVIAEAQTWSNTAPGIAVRATMGALREFRTDSAIDLDFGSDGITSGVTKGVLPEASHSATGTGGKVEIRFNTGTKVTVSGTDLRAIVGASTYTLTPVYQCAVATSDTGLNKVNFPTSCTAGYEWLNADVPGLTNRWVLVGATINGTDSDGKPSAIYEGTLTLSLSASSM